jgi:uroporphyrinogen-III synthase
MDWALVQEGRVGREGVLMLLDDRSTAESIAAELRKNGQRVSVRPYLEVEGGPGR